MNVQLLTSLSFSPSLSPPLSPSLSLSPSHLPPISSSVNLVVVSLTLSPYNCLLEGMPNLIQCVVNGLPDPTVTFERSFDAVECPINGSCTIDTVTEGDLTTSNLTFNQVSTFDQGINTCTVCVHVHMWCAYTYTCTCIHDSMFEVYVYCSVCIEGI